MIFDIFKKKIKEITQSKEELIYTSYFQDKLISEDISYDIQITSINTGFVRNENFGISPKEPEYLNNIDVRFKEDTRDEKGLKFLPQVDSFVLNIDIQLDKKNLLTVQILRTQYAELRNKNCSAKNIEFKYTKNLFLNKTAVTFEDFSNLFPDFLSTYNSAIKAIIENRNIHKQIQHIDKKIQRIDNRTYKLLEQKKHDEKILALRN